MPYASLIMVLSLSVAVVIGVVYLILGIWRLRQRRGTVGEQYILVTVQCLTFTAVVLAIIGSMVQGWPAVVLAVLLALAIAGAMLGALISERREQRRFLIWERNAAASPTAAVPQPSGQSEPPAGC